MQCGRCAALAAWLPLAMGACQRQSAAPDEVLAVVEGQPLTAQAFRHWWEARHLGADTAEGRAQVLEQLIERAALAQAARQAGLDQDPALAEQFEALLIARLRETRLQPQLAALQVSEAEARAAYESGPGQALRQPEGARVAVLWFNTRGQAPLVARYQPRLEEIRRQVLADAVAFPVGGGFGALSASNSEHATSRLKGGDLGWLDVGSTTDPWRAAVLEAAGALRQVGELSEVKATNQGLFLVRLLERRAASLPPFEAARPLLERKLLEQRRRDAEQQWTRDILAGAKVERFPQHLLALAPLPLAAPRQPVPPLSKP